MTGRCRRTAAALVVTVSCTGPPLAAQTTGSLDVSASFVEYDGFLPSAAAVFSAALRHDTPNLSAGGAAGWTWFESGNQILQATAAAAWFNSPRSDAWRLELAAASGISRYADESATGHVLARARMHLLRGNTGAWLSLTSGTSSGDSAGMPVEVSAAAWRLQQEIAFVGTAAAVRLADYRHLDLQGSLRWTRSPIELELRFGVRPVARASERAWTGAYGDASFLLSVTSHLSVAVSGGSYPSDPIRGLLAASYVNAGIRIRLAGAHAPDPAAIVTAALRATSGGTPNARLEVTGSGDPRTLRVLAPGARTVELMGDFTDWQPVALTRVGHGAWEIRLPLSPGVHRVNVRIDGGDWTVPAGARAEPSEFGGVVGVVVVR
ncbi:MAG TPA: glycogen-binding domain-containing protein [Longimicrobiales bacterium]